MQSGPRRNGGSRERGGGSGAATGRHGDPPQHHDGEDQGRRLGGGGIAASSRRERERQERLEQRAAAALLLGALLRVEHGADGVVKDGLEALLRQGRALEILDRLDLLLARKAGRVCDGRDALGLELAERLSERRAGQGDGERGKDWQGEGRGRKKKKTYASSRRSSLVPTRRVGVFGQWWLTSGCHCIGAGREGD